MSIDETVKALRNCAYDNSCEGCSFAMVVDDEDCKDNMMIAVADQLEQLQAENSMLKSGNKQIVEDYKLCVAERDELKEQVKVIEIICNNGGCPPDKNCPDNQNCTECIADWLACYRESDFVAATEKGGVRSE